MIWSWTCEQSKTNAISACLSICLYACMNVWMYACMYVSMYVRMYGRPDLKRPVQYIYYMCIYIYNNYIYTKSIKKTRYTQTVCATKTICRWVTPEVLQHPPPTPTWEEKLLPSQGRSHRAAVLTTSPAKRNRRRASRTCVARPDNHRLDGAKTL